MSAWSSNVSQLLQFQIEASQLSPRTKSPIPEMTLGRLSAYRANLAGLCQREPARVSISKADGLGKALHLARNAVKLSPSKSGLLDIAEFQASRGVISKVAGVVSSPSAEHARRSILHAIQKARKTLTALLGHLRNTRSHLNSRGMSSCGKDEIRPPAKASRRIQCIPPWSSRQRPEGSGYPRGSVQSSR